jgi:hypothetical protein
VAGQVETLAFVVMVGLAMAAVAVWFWKPHFTFDRTLTVIILVWAYHAFSVPLDLWVGFDVLGSHRLPDPSDKKVWDDVVRIALHHATFILALLLGYELAGGARGAARLDPPPPTGFLEWLRRGYRPPLWSVYAVAVAAGVVYWGLLDTAHRGVQEIWFRDDTWGRAVSLVVDVSLAWTTWYVLSIDDRRRALLALPAAGLIGLFTGARTSIAVVVLVLLLRFRVRLTVAARAVAVVVTGALIFLWKPAYHAMAVFVLTGAVPPLLVPSFPGFAGLESSDAWAYFVHFLRAGPSPWWLGWSYLGGTLVTALPRALRGAESAALAERYAVELTAEPSDVAHGAGFSALAEAWLNFGDLGPALAGLAWGLAAGRLDTRPRGIGFYLFAIMSLRFLRSDFASLVKSWGLIFGGCLLGVALLFRLFTLSAAASRPERVPA